jgi:hypothetical protein
MRQHFDIGWEAIDGQVHATIFTRERVTHELAEFKP